MFRKQKLILNYEVYSSSRRAQDVFLLKIALEMARADTESGQTQGQIRPGHQAALERELTGRHGRQHHAFSFSRKMPRNSFPERRFGRESTDLNIKRLGNSFLVSLVRGEATKLHRVFSEFRVKKKLR